MEVKIWGVLLKCDEKSKKHLKVEEKIRRSKKKERKKKEKTRARKKSEKEQKSKKKKSSGSGAVVVCHPSVPSVSCSRGKALCKSIGG